VSDSSQIIVDVEASEADAAKLGQRILQHLIAEKIVEAAESDSILGDTPGHRPGPGAAAVVTGSMKMPMRLATNGLAVHVGRQVFHTGGNGVELSCGACRATFDPGGAYFDAVTAWHNGDENVTFACPACKHSARLTAWDGPFAFGFGALGLELWNWPPLKPQFVSSIAQLLGHRVVLVHCHL